MTDRIDSLTVVLDKDYRDDDVQTIVNAISMIRGVSLVTPRVVDNVTDHVARERARNEVREKIMMILHPRLDPEMKGWPL